MQRSESSDSRGSATAPLHADTRSRRRRAAQISAPFGVSGTVARGSKAGEGLASTRREYCTCAAAPHANGRSDTANEYARKCGSSAVSILSARHGATGDAATAPRTPAGGAQLAPDPDSAVALGPEGELIDSIRTNDSDANTITVAVNDTTVTVSPAENGEVATNGRLTLTHPARVRVTGQGMLPGATATVWIKSDPQRLGTVTITADGLLDATFPVPTSIDPGNHTIQIDTTDPDGEALTLALGLTITSGVLPTTGTNTNLDWIVLFIALGCLSALVGGRRRRELH